MKYDREVDDLIASLQYFTSNPRKSLLSKTLGLAKSWYELIEELEESKPSSILWSIRSFAKIMEITFGAVTTIVSAVATAAAHPVHTHKLRTNMDKLQDPKVLSVLLSDEKFWKFVEKNLDSVRAIALKSATPELKGLLSDILKPKIIKDLRFTFGNEQHKDFFKKLFIFTQDKEISRGAATLAMYQHQVDKLPAEDKKVREHALREIKSFLTSKEFTGFMRNLCGNNNALLEAMAKHPPLKGMLDMYGINYNVFKNIINGPLKDHPETINYFFEAYMSGRFVQNVLELSRDKPCY